MKIMFISDIHGIKTNLEKIKKKFKELKCDKLVVLGDLYYIGPRNKMVEGYDIAAVQNFLESMKENLICIRGNCDSRVDAFVLEKEFYDLKKIKIHGLEFILTHGDLFNESNIKIKKHSVFLYGHTHIYVLKRLDNGSLVINPGSISLPKNGNPRTYVIFDDEKGIFSLYNIEDELIQTISVN